MLSNNDFDLPRKKKKKNYRKKKRENQYDSKTNNS